MKLAEFDEAAERVAGVRLMRRVKALFALQGRTYTQWAKEQGYSQQMVSWSLLHPLRPQCELASRIRQKIYAELGDSASGAEDIKEFSGEQERRAS